MVPSDQEIQSFLDEVISLIEEGKTHFIAKRRGEPTFNYIRELLRLSLESEDDAWEEIKKLDVKNCCKIEEENNPNYSGDVWFFQKEVNGERAYIKIKVDNRGCVCIAFHIYNRFNE